MYILIQIKQEHNIVKKHQRKYKPDQKFQTLLMPFYCFKAPYRAKTFHLPLQDDRGSAAPN